jgi:iturin family lipopeptide synthetase A
MRELFEDAGTPARLTDLIAQRSDTTPGQVADPAPETSIPAAVPDPSSRPTAVGAAIGSLAGQIEAMARQSQEIEAQLAALRRRPATTDVERPAVHGPRVTVSRSSGMAGGAASESQRAHVDDLVRRYVAKTRTSKEIAQRHRGVLADSRAVVGFRTGTKEMLYPVAGRRAHGSWLEDVDGNRYVDITMGFGVLLFGHEPDFVTEAVREHLSRGVQLGPRNVETGEAATLLSVLTGMPRVAFANSGTEANSAAIRLARAATGRSKVVMFNGSYHGHADNVLGRSVGTGSDRETVPVSTGIPGSAVRDLVVLDYGAQESIDYIDAMGADLAAVIVEPVQSRNPALQPVEFVRSLRQVTSRHGIVLMFDEMLTGFRPHPRGAQGFFGVTPDLATYGKALGGGFPIGAIAGRADIMDGVDGGFWRYGDDSCPQRETTFFGGTYIQHPVSMVAARAVLDHLRTHSPALQERLNARTDELARALNTFFSEEGFPIRVNHFGSMFRFEHRADMELLYHHLLLKGVFIWEWRNFFLSTAHTDADIEFVVDAVTSSLRELRAAGFFAHPRAVSTAAVLEPVSPVTAADPVAAGPGSRGGAPFARTAGRRAATAATPRPAPDFSVYYFGDYPAATAPDDKYRSIIDTARFADQHGFHALWMPERHFHSFGGLFPNPVVLAAALARETRRIRLHAGSVVLPLHDPVRVAEEWSMVDNLSGGRVGIGCASGWHANDFVFFPENFGRHREVMYSHLAELRRLWRGETVLRRSGSGEEVPVQLLPRPVQDMPPMFTAIVGRRESYELAARHDLGVVTNLMTQTVDQLTENVALYRKTRADHGLDADAGRVVVLLHTYLGEDRERARAEAFEPLSAYMRSSLSLFGEVTNSLGFNVDVTDVVEEDLDYLFRRAHDRYCDSRALIGSVDDCTPTVDALRNAGADEVAALVDFGVTPDQLRRSLPQLDRLRRRYHEDAEPARGGCPARESILLAPAAPRPVDPDVRARPAAVEPVRPERVAEEPADVAPLAPGQQRIWFVERLFPGRSAYNEPKAIRLEGSLDVPALRGALDQLIRRHPVLRTVFREIDGEPRQVVSPRGEADLAVVDCAGEAEDDVVRLAMSEESRRRFDLSAGPLFVTRLLRLSENRHVLVFSMHHVVVDAASATVLTRDLSELYRAWLEARPVALPPLPRSYADFARAQLAAADSRKAAADLGYWLDRLGGELPVLELHTDRPRPAMLTSNGRASFRTLDAELSEQVRTLSRTHRVTLFMTLLTALAVTLRRFSGQDDIIIGTPVSDRPAGTEDVVGFFLNTVALRFDLTGDPTFAELLRRTRATTLDAYDHADVPFETVVRGLSPKRDTGRNPIFAVLAEFENDAAFRLDLPDVRSTPLDVGADKALVDLTLYLTDRPDGVACHLEYNTDLFDAATAERFMTFFTAVLAGSVRDPDARLSRLVDAAQTGVPGPAGMVQTGRRSGPGPGRAVPPRSRRAPRGRYAGGRRRDRRRHRSDVPGAERTRRPAGRAAPHGRGRCRRRRRAVAVPLGGTDRGDVGSAEGRRRVPAARPVTRPAARRRHGGRQRRPPASDHTGGGRAATRAAGRHHGHARGQSAGRPRSGREHALGGGSRRALLRDLHVGVHRAAEGGRGHARQRDEPLPVAAPHVRVRRRRSQRRGVRAELRRVRGGDLAGPHRRREHRGGRRVHPAGHQGTRPLVRGERRDVRDPADGARRGTARAAGGRTTAAAPPPGRRGRASCAAATRPAVRGGQRLRSDRDDRPGDERAGGRLGDWRRADPDRPADRQHQPAGAGPRWQARHGGRDRRAVHRRRRRGAGLPQPSGADPGAVRAGSVRRGGRPAVPNRRSGPLEHNGCAGIPRALRRSGEDPRVPGRTRRRDAGSAPPRPGVRRGHRGQAGPQG